MGRLLLGESAPGVHMQERRRVPPTRLGAVTEASVRACARGLPGGENSAASRGHGAQGPAAVPRRPLARGQTASHRAARGGRRPVPCVKAGHAGHSCPSGNGRGLPWTLQAAVWVISGTRRRPLPVGRGRSPRAGCARPLLGSCHCGRTCGDQLQMRTCPRGPLPEIEATKSRGAERTLEKAL